MMTSISQQAWLQPWIKLFRGEKPAEQLQQVSRSLGVPLLGIAAFLLIWTFAAAQINTSLGQFPGPQDVWSQSGTLITEHFAEREEQAAFYERQRERIKERQAVDPSYDPPIIPYTGKPTYLDQIVTSLITVASGFILASIIAIPLGIVIGLSGTLYRAFNPVMQLLKPVSPLAWLPLVTMVVSAVYVSQDPTVPKSFLNSMITVMLCCLWPTVINTAVGVASVDNDLVNVSRVLRLGWFTHVRTIVLPSAIPMMFTGLRTSLGIAWMVLIAAEMLAQSPGLGKFVWDEFQNGSSHSLSRIMVAVITIGVIGFLLDRLILSIQGLVSWDKSANLR
jgi:nitrate/nitrite transport system permease protein